MQAKITNGQIQYPYTLSNLRRDNRNTMFPADFTDWEAWGCVAVVATEKPAGDIVIEGTPEFVNGAWRQTWIVSGFSVEQNKARIAARRYQEEIKGITVNGSQIKTDHASQMKMIGAALAATIDPAKTRKWKAGGGFVDINAATTVAVAQAVDAHVQACFDREAVLVAAVDAGTYTSSMLDEGWPK